MRIILFDAILERHTCESLERALRARGHDVRWTGPIWQGHRLPSAAGDRERIRGHVDQICREGADALVCLRASALHPDEVERLNRRGIHTLVWLPDDPVLYRICYRHVIAAYRTVLHCGGASILRFYEERHGRATGINFPFWTDAEAFPRRRAHDPARAEVDVVFLGNCVGRVRGSRYELLASLPFRARIHGRVDEDPAGIAGGFLEGTAAVAGALGAARLGLNLAQWFRDYAGTAYDFPGLAELGHFQYPSRVVQYAAVGLPVVSLSDPEAHDSFPELCAAATRGEWVELARRLLADEELLRAASEATHRRFVKSFSAEARAALIERELKEPGFWRAMDAHTRARLFAGEDGEPAPLLPRRKRVLVSGFYGHENTGDELILRSLVEGIRRSAPEIEVSVASEHPERVERLHPVSAFRRSDPEACVAEASNASAVVVGGGGIWHDYSFARSGGLAALFTGNALSVTGFSQLPLLARALGLDVHVFGVGVGPLVHEDAARLVRFVIGLARSVTVRDEGSRRMLDAAGWTGPPVACSPDPVFALDLGVGAVPAEVEELRRGGRVLGVSLRTWDFGAGPGLHEQLVPALCEVVARHADIALVGIPMQGGERRDRRALRDVFDRVSGARASAVLPWTPRLDRLVGTLAACDALVAMRLHACLLGHRLGTPVVGIDYDPKIGQHFGQVGAAGRLLPLDAPAARIAEAIGAALAGKEVSRAPSRSAIDALEADARRGIEGLARQLEAAPVRLRSTAAWPSAAGDDARGSEQAEDGDEDLAGRGDALAARASRRWPYWGEDDRLSDVWHCPARDSLGRVAAAPEGVRVAVAAGASAFYVAARGGGFASPPADAEAWSVAAGAVCLVEVDLALESRTEGEGLAVGLWIIEYSDDARLCHTQRVLESGTNRIVWRTSGATRSIRLALRFEGSGAAVLGPIAFAEDLVQD